MESRTLENQRHAYISDRRNNYRIECEKNYLLRPPHCTGIAIEMHFPAVQTIGENIQVTPTYENKSHVDISKIIKNYSIDCEQNDLLRPPHCAGTAV